jgi:hypothetical protein
MSQNRISQWSHLSLFIEQGLPVQIPFGGDPWSTVAFNPQTGQLSLFVETESGFGVSPPPVDIDVQAQDLGPRRGWIVCTERRDLYFHFYCFICAIVDEMSIRGKSPADAFESSVASFRDLIEREAVLSSEKQIGLLAELLVLKEIAQFRPWAWCLDAWHRDANAEHDFNLGTADLEVKATVMESRTHMIGSLQQLEPSLGRSLFLASFQFTRNDHADALKLIDIVAEIEDSIRAEDEQLLDRFSSRLKKVGYRREHARFYQTGVGYRTPPLVFLVDDSFPRLVPASLNFPIPANRQRIVQVSYRTNLDGLDGRTLPDHLVTTLGG